MMHIDTMADYFEQLYQPLDVNEKREIGSLDAGRYIPVTDVAYKMKKGGWDYSLKST